MFLYIPVIALSYIVSDKVLADISHEEIVGQASFNIVVSKSPP